MTSFSNRCLLAIVVSLLLFLPSCHRNTTQSGPQYIMLTFNNGACEQNGSTDLVEISPDQPLIYQGAASLNQFEVQFNACPFGSCPVNSPHGTSMNVGQPNPGTAGKTFNYTGMTINNQSCSNGGAMGLRIKSGP